MNPHETVWFNALEPAQASRVKESVQDMSLALSELEGLLERKPVVGITSNDRDEWVSAWLAAYANGASVFLANPDWQEAAWEETARQITPDVVFGDWKLVSDGALKPPLHVPPAHWFIPTGGTGGHVKFVAHNEKTFRASARALSEVCGGEAINSLSLLPLHHVSGLMPWARAAYTGGAVRFADWHEIRAGSFPEKAGHEEQLSLVPSQLWQLLECPAACEWLTQFKHVLIGGAACDPRLVANARALGIAATPCYGMTETAAFIAWQPPGSASSDKSLSAAILPHTRVSLSEDNEIHLEGDSLAVGVWQTGQGISPLKKPFPTGDIGELSNEGCLTVTGRKDRLINTGGEKVYPERVEAVLRADDCVEDVYVTGVDDERWGQAVVALVVLCEKGAPNFESLKAHAAAQLEPPAIPKKWVFVEMLPRTATGKIDRESALRLLSSSASD